MLLEVCVVLEKKATWAKVKATHCYRINGVKSQVYYVLAIVAAPLPVETNCFLSSVKALFSERRLLRC